MENTNVECKRDLHRPMWVLPLYALLPRAKQSRVRNSFFVDFKNSEDSAVKDPPQSW